MRGGGGENNFPSYLSWRQEENKKRQLSWILFRCRCDPEWTGKAPHRLSSLQSLEDPTFIIYNWGNSNAGLPNTDHYILTWFFMWIKNPPQFELFQRQHWGNFWEEGLSAYGLSLRGWAQVGDISKAVRTGEGGLSRWDPYVPQGCPGSGTWGRGGNTAVGGARAQTLLSAAASTRRSECDHSVWRWGLPADSLKCTTQTSGLRMWSLSAGWLTEMYNTKHGNQNVITQCGVGVCRLTHWNAQHKPRGSECDHSVVLGAQNVITQWRWELRMWSLRVALGSITVLHLTAPL